jgi:2-polyprenyl-3-methyl-5-hydroxy-6-metoxy-1,4-benzoquinol methylase
LEIDDIRRRWNREAVEFDAIYGSSSAVMRVVNRFLRRAVLQRFDFTIDEMLPTMGATVLDVGCGSGVLAEGLLKAGAESVTGVDVSQGMLDLAENRLNGPMRDGKVSLICEDFTEWQAESRFDYVVALGVFDYSGDSQQLIRRMRAFALRRLVISLPTQSRFRFRSSIRRIRYRIQGKGDVYYYSRDDAEELAKMCGASSYRLRDLGSGQGFLLVVDIE